MNATPIADMVRVMLERDVPRDVIVTAIEAAERHAETVTHHAERHVTARDAKDKSAERARRYRERKKRDASRDGKKSPLTTSSSPNTQTVEKEENKKARVTRHGVTLPTDWQPSAKHFDEGWALGLNERDVTEMANDMRLWAGANANRAVAKKSNWDMTFSGWMRREAGKRKPNNGKSGIIDAADRAIESLTRREAADSSPGIGSQAAFRLISQG